MTVLEFDLVGNYFTAVMSMIAVLGVVWACDRFARSRRHLLREPGSGPASLS